MEHQLDAAVPIDVVHFRETRIVANEEPAADPFEIDRHDVIACRIDSQVAPRAHRFVVPIDDLSFARNDVKAVRRLLVSGKVMRGAQHDPDVLLLGQLHDLMRVAP